MRTSWVLPITVVALTSLAGIESSFAVDWWNPDFRHRKRITIKTQDQTLPPGEWVNFSFDHKYLVDGGKSLPEGEDIRLVYWNGHSNVELYRILDHHSDWNTRSTKIWFKIEVGISAGASDPNYYLYYHCPSARSPPVVQEMETEFKEMVAPEARRKEEATRALEEAMVQEGLKAREKARLIEEGQRQVELPGRQAAERQEQLRRLREEARILAQKTERQRRRTNLLLAIMILIVLLLTIFIGIFYLSSKVSTKVAPSGFKARRLAERLEKGRVRAERKDLFKR